MTTTLSDKLIEAEAFYNTSAGRALLIFKVAYSNALIESIHAARDSDVEPFREAVRAAERELIGEIKRLILIEEEYDSYRSERY